MSAEPAHMAEVREYRERIAQSLENRANATRAGMERILARGEAFVAEKEKSGSTVASQAMRELLEHLREE